MKNIVMNEIVNIPKFNYKELSLLNFGELEGEDDNNVLKSSLILTNSILNILRKEYNYILSPKGAGKSAIFNAFKNKLFSDEYVDYSTKKFICINDSFVFDNEYLNPQRFKHNLENKNYAFAWALYLISKLINDITENYILSACYDEFISKIRKIENFKEDFDLANIWDILENLNIQCDFIVNGQQFKVAPKMGSKNKRKRINLNEIFNLINEFYKQNDVKTLILIDRIDNFVGQEEYKIQKKYIEGLVSAIEEIRRQTNIQPILFLRTDLFKSLDIQFEYDKVKARTIHLKWTKIEIVRFLALRLFSNKYIFDNYKSILYNSIAKEVHSENKFKLLLYKLSILRRKNHKIDLEKTTNYKIFENFLKAFLPDKVNHINNAGVEEQMELFEWIDSHFVDNNEYINPRCLIYFFNKLSVNQYDAYESDINLQSSDFFCNLTNKNPIMLNVFMPEVIQKTYYEICNDELIGIKKLLENQNEQKLFLKINEISYKTGSFNYGSISYIKYGVDRLEYERLIKYLNIIGFSKDQGSKQYSIPLIYRFRIKEE